MSDTKECKFCGNIIDIDAQTCEYCGKSQYKKKEELCCANCKAPVSESDHVCPYCGAVFDYITVEEEVVPENTKHNIYGIHYNIIIFLTALATSITLTLFSAVGKDTTQGANLIFFSVAFVVAEISLYIYLLPSIIAIEKNNPNIYLIYFCNMLLGITVIGWFISFGMALQSKKN